MRIGIDGRELTGHATGVGRYVENLCDVWSSEAFANSHSIIVYTHAPIADQIPRDRVTGANISYVTLPGEGNIWWEQTRLAFAINRDNIDVFFGPGYSLPLGTTVPSVVTLHDLSFFRRPDWFGLKEGLRRRTLTQTAVQIANRIITVSEFSKQELVDLLGVPTSRIQVIYNGITPFTRETVDNRDTRRLILYVGSIFNRRHIPTLITAFSHVHRVLDDAELVIVGPNRTYPHQNLDLLAKQQGVEDHVEFSDYVTEDRLRDLYRKARVFVFLSEYEGFGMTPLEALTAGVPAIVGDTQVAREVYRNGARYVNVNDANEVAAAILKLLSDTSLHNEHVEIAKSSVSRYTWTATAKQTMETLETTAGYQS